MPNKYSPTEFVKTAYSLFMTKVFFHSARLIRRPIYIRGRKSMVGGKGLTTGRFCRFDLEGQKKTLIIGDDCEFGDLTHIVAYDRVEIGKNVLIASKCFISDTNHGDLNINDTGYLDTPPNKRPLTTKPTKIGNNVWIGENAVILAGSVIGDGCIVGANSLVSSVIPPYSKVVGVNRVLNNE